MIGVAIVAAGVGVFVLYYLPAAPPVEEDSSTVQYEYWDFFKVPYADFWDIRAAQYFEWPMNAECFNSSSIAQGLCKPTDPNVPDVLEYPYAHYYSAINPSIFPDTANGSIWAPYRMRVTGTNVSGYSLREPVFLPVFNYGEAPGSRLEFSWYMQYLNKTRENEIGLTCGTNFVFGNDGYILESQIALQLDLQESKRIFGVVANTPAEAASWWAANTDPECLRQREIENTVSDWFVTMGGGPTTIGKYDIATGFEWYYQPFRTNLSASVDLDTGLTTVRIDHFGYGTEVLLARMFYWGNTSYQDHYLDSTQRKGWWGMENAWFEDFHFSGNLDANVMNFTLRTVVQYTLQHVCDPGPNGLYDRVDDVPLWRWGPLLDDYVADWGSTHTLSELDRYPGETYTLCAPGLPENSYGGGSSYDFTPTTWNLKRNETWTFRFPATDVVFYDPNLTPSSANPLRGEFAKMLAPLQLNRVSPSGMGTWDPATLTWTVTGPAGTGGAEGSPGPDGVAGTADDRYPAAPLPSIELRPGTASGAPPAPVEGPSATRSPPLASAESLGAANPAPRSLRPEPVDTSPRGWR